MCIRDRSMIVSKTEEAKRRRQLDIFDNQFSLFVGIRGKQSFKDTFSCRRYSFLCLLLLKFIRSQYLPYTAPTRKTPNVFIINIDVCIYFPAHIFIEYLLRIVFINSIKHNSILPTVLHSLIKFLPCTECPQNKHCSKFFELLKCLKSKKFLFADFRILVFNYCSIKIHRNLYACKVNLSLIHISEPTRPY